ncbi:hypothetical protein [Streptomyces sp. ME19-01-6]|uniref:hypothetical protein n=1 Tax=Streptomyces sp. ME19-01-6 TaxID=3028686 RepID=UPI0029AAB658|nr:hypothetical protein [Streptomyces sp. ME19-01-6]MDX3232951.1 hypothetical protein [Streptomyces sp. ME19-01-6]
MSALNSASATGRAHDAATVDHLGRPVCDGTTRRATRNCTKLADFQLKQPGAKAASGYACEAHAGQVARVIADGEAGLEYEQRLIPIRTKE